MVYMMKMHLVLAICLLVLLTLSGGQNVLARAYLNTAALAYLHMDGFLSDESKKAIKSDLLHALAVASERAPSVSLLRGIGHLALLVNEARIGLEAFDRVEETRKTDWLLQRDNIIALSLEDVSEEVIPRVSVQYLSVFSEYDVVLRDTIAWSAWDLLMEDSLTPGERLKLLSIAKRARPYDLATNLELWKQTDDSLAERAIRDFDQRAVEFSDQRLLNANVEKVPEILEYGLWDEDMAVRVLSYWVTIYPENMMLSTQLDVLSSVYNHRLEWQVLRAELAYRRGEWQSAKDQFLELGASNPQYSTAYLFLGLICERSPGICQAGEQCQFFQHYTSIAPTDALGSIKSAECLSTDAEINPLLVEQTHIAAKSLQVPMESIRLGANLLPDVASEGSSLRKTPLGWRVSYTESNPNFDPGEFIVSEDTSLTYDGDRSALIVGFWHGEHESSRTRSTNGYQVWNNQSDQPFSLALQPGDAYLLTVAYRTEAVPSVNERAIFVPFGAGIPELQLFPTNGEWRLSSTVLCNSSREAFPISVLIVRSSLLGRTWFDGIELKKINREQDGFSDCNLTTVQ